MSVWYVIPSARPAAEAELRLRLWRGMGYQVAVFRDEGAGDIKHCRNIHGPYPGYANAVNLLARLVLRDDPACGWVVTGGDDITPDPVKDADTIARECTAYFGGTLGVMQPTGDRHMVDKGGKASADRVCCSPWMGRDWCLRGYNGNGPMWGGYFHFFVDNDLHDVATKHGILWHRRDLTQHHAWWGREGSRDRPEFLTTAHDKWAMGRDIYEKRRAAGFPESGILPP